MNTLRAASVQFNHRPGDKDYNLNRIEFFCVKAAESGVDILVFPEMCISGYWHVRNLSREQISKMAESVPAGSSTQSLLKLSSEHKITIGAGLIEISPDGKLYNSYVVAMPDGKTARHRKLHCFISSHMESGSEFTVFELPQGIKAGILICYDNNINENVRITAMKGAEILLAPHQTGGCHSPSPRCMGTIDPALWQNRENNPAAIEAEICGSKGRDWLMRWLPARAHDNGIFLIFSNGIGVDDDEVRTGNSMIIDPYGEILKESRSADDDIIIADLDMKVRENCTGSRWIRSRRPELYKMLSEKTGLEADTRKLRFDFGEVDKI